MTAQCDAWFSSLYKYSYLLAYQRRRDFAIAVNSDCTTGFQSVTHKQFGKARLNGKICDGHARTISRVTYVQ